MGPFDPKPERYVVYWYDWEKGDRIAKQNGCLPEDVDPADIEEMADFKTLKAARKFRDKKLSDGAYIEERVNIHTRQYDWGIIKWEWDQEVID